MKYLKYSKRKVAATGNFAAKKPRKAQNPPTGVVPALHVSVVVADGVQVVHVVVGRVGDFPAGFPRQPRRAGQLRRRIPLRRR